jgi:hypothetical protein
MPAELVVLGIFLSRAGGFLSHPAVVLVAVVMSQTSFGEAVAALVFLRAAAEVLWRDQKDRVSLPVGALAPGAVALPATSILQQTALRPERGSVSVVTLR